MPRASLSLWAVALGRQAQGSKRLALQRLVRLDRSELLALLWRLLAPVAAIAAVGGLARAAIAGEREADARALANGGKDWRAERGA